VQLATPTALLFGDDALLTTADAVNTLIVLQKQETGKDYKIVFG
jgi:hypothetical protein